MVWRTSRSSSFRLPSLASKRDQDLLDNADLSPTQKKDLVGFALVVKS
jgi:hypothetical protein